MSLEEDSGARDRIAEIFRTIHTIKGTAGFLGFSSLERLTHKGESLLSTLRDGSLDLTPAITSGLLKMVDEVRLLLRNIEETGKEGDANHDALIAELLALNTPGAPASPQAVKPNKPPSPADEPSATAAASEVDGAPPTRSAPAPSAVAPESSAPAVAPAPAQPTSAPAPAPAQPASAPAATPVQEMIEPAPVAQKARQSSVAESYVRVDVQNLDRLMNLVGELVLARNQLNRLGSRFDAQAFQSTSQMLNLITSELQEGVMKTRMQPIGNVWDKLPRVVRDLAVTCGKQVRIQMVGRETEIDRAILEAIKDPLTHIVRNAIDHGLESADVRAAKGKPRTGILSLRAAHESGHITIEVSDDGGGFNLDRVGKKAVERGLLTPDQLARISARDLSMMIFAPAFSTAAQVTNVSGRGVGMDVVKTNIEKIGGAVDIVSQPGEGTTIRLKIPLTLAIVPALIVSTSNGQERFAIPQANLVELVRLKGEKAISGVEFIRERPVMRLRGNLLPLIYLDKVLQLQPSVVEPGSDPVLNVVVVQADKQTFGLVVEGILDTEEIVVKPLGKVFNDLTVFAGATIMGDGRVALIVDVAGLANHAQVLRPNRSDGTSDHDAITNEASNDDSAESLLLFELPGHARMAVPLNLVDRLEEFEPERIENVGKFRVIQYRNEILRLIELNEILGGVRPPADKPTNVIVYSTHWQTVGISVGKITDIVQGLVQGATPVTDSKFLKAAIVDGKITEILDIQTLVESRLQTMRGLAA